MGRKPATLFGAIATVWACAAWSALPAQSPPDRSGTGGKAATIDACAVLTRAEIKNLSGRDPGPPRPSGSGNTTICYWEATSPRGSVVLNALAGNANYQSMDATLKTMVQRGKKARAVSVLGQQAIFVAESGEVASGTLFVKVDHYTLSIWRQALPSATADSVLPTLTAFAKAAIPKLSRAGCPSCG